MATFILAQWATSLQYEDLSQPVRDAALRSFYNWLGCAVGGSDHPTVERAYLGTRAFFGHDRSVTLYGRRRWDDTDDNGTADVLHGALLNGIASHVHDYDDTHLATIVHPTGPVASAALAYAEAYNRRSERVAMVDESSSSNSSNSSSSSSSSITTPVISGRDVLLAVVAGIEASCKLGLAVWPEHYDVGWHITGTTGAIGAAVAVGRLKQLDAERMAHAIGLASVSVTGLREMFGADAKSFHVGEAALVGVRAASMAEHGFTSSVCALEAKRGWANVVAGGGIPQLDRYSAELGKVWEIERNSFKPFPCGIVCHPAIDAAIQLRQKIEEAGLQVDLIKRFHATVHPLVIELTSKRKPKDGLEGKFSVFHGCAVGLLYGQAHPSEYTDEVVRDPRVVKIRDRVEATLDDGASGSGSGIGGIRPDEAWLEAESEDGRTFKVHVDHAVGSLNVPMTDDQLKDKFVAQSSRVLGGGTAGLVSELAWGFRDVPDVAVFMDELRIRRGDA